MDFPITRQMRREAERQEAKKDVDHFRNTSTSVWVKVTKKSKAGIGYTHTKCAIVPKVEIAKAIMRKVDKLNAEKEAAVLDKPEAPQPVAADPERLKF